VLAQWFSTTLASGKVVTKLHPIAFASKRTSEAERKYKPFLLEFAALKYSLDKFCDITWGYPIEVETDCQALRDVLMNDKLSATHARWRESVLSHQIRDVRHIPGKKNVAADGVSRTWENILRGLFDDGSDWTVNEDWDDSWGLVNDLMLISPKEVAEEGKVLLERFQDEPIFREVVESLLTLKTDSDLRTKRRATKRAREYFISEGKLWRLRGGPMARARGRPKVECISRKEAVELAKVEHETRGHWRRDLIKAALHDKYWSPQLDNSITAAIESCARCKNFGPTHLHTLLDPITRRHPYGLVVGDYLKLPKGKGGYHTVGLYLDCFSQHVWGDKWKKHGSAATTISTMTRITETFMPPETFMTDGGSHFNNKEVKDWCKAQGIEYHVVAEYSPWINGLVEGTNRILLHVLKRLCAPELGEDTEEFKRMDWAKLPDTWPGHFDNALQILNWRILPALKFRPKELLFGLPINTVPTPIEDSASVLKPEDVNIHIAYAEQA
jgi:transposase InsO family protein